MYILTTLSIKKRLDFMAYFVVYLNNNYIRRFMVLLLKIIGLALLTTLIILLAGYSGYVIGKSLSKVLIDD